MCMRIPAPNFINTTTEPASGLATNGNLYLDFALEFSSIAQGGNYIRIHIVTVTVFN
jgi:hypothetical protein